MSQVTSTLFFRFKLTAIFILVVKAVSTLSTSGRRAQMPTMGSLVCSDSLVPALLISHVSSLCQIATS